MAAQPQGRSGYFVWQIAGKAVAVHIHLDVVDRLSVQVTTGSGPSRGAEVGGVLLGTIEHDDLTVVRIEDFEPVESEHKNGPSYILGDEDRPGFEDACNHWQPDESRPVYAVGFYRSHLRDGLSLAPEDVELLDRYFAAPAHVALLIKPYGTKVSLGGFFIREDGLFPVSTELEFPFRRRELSGGEDPPPRSSYDANPSETYRRFDKVLEPAPDLGPTRSRLRSAVWIPLSFVFLLFGVALGLMIALGRDSGSAAHDSQNFSLGLSISRADDNLNVRWDRQAPAIRTAERGALEIEDGSYTKSVDLDAAQLKNGSIIYRNSSVAVRFRLVVYPKARVSVTETMDWKK